jgi:hypothetical protein
MVDWTARVVGIRTTRDGGGRACGIVTGMGATPQLALDDLRSEAEGLAQQVGQEATEAAKADWEAAKQAAGRRGEPPPPVLPWRSATKRLDYRFEVVDVRLTPTLMEDGGSGWLAYGTLVHEAKLQADEARHERASTTSRPAGGYGGAPGAGLTQRSGAICLMEVARPLPHPGDLLGPGGRHGQPQGNHRRAQRAPPRAEKTDRRARQRRRRAEVREQTK